MRNAMKRAFLSIFVIAASGAYVVHETYGGANLSGALAGTADPLQERVPGDAAVAPTLAGPAEPVQEVVPADPAVEPALPQPAPEVDVRAAPPEPASPPPPEPPPVQPVAVVTAEIQGPAPATVPDVAEGPAPVPLPAPVPIPRLKHSRKPAADATMKETSAPVSAAYVQAQYRDGTYRGAVANAYYGMVQVEATIQGGRLVSVKAVRYPSDRQTSRRINRQALPMLQGEAISAQSAKVDIISGATLTSRAYRRSLDAALAGAGA